MSFVPQKGGGLTPLQTVNIQYPVRQIRGTSVSGQAGDVIPKHVTNVQVSSVTSTDKQTTLVSVYFQRDPSDPHFDHVRILSRGLNNNAGHSILTLGKDSPVRFTLPNSGAPAGLVVQAVGNHGAAPLRTAPSGTFSTAAGAFGGIGALARSAASNLGQLPDSPARKAMTAGSVSYRPLVNPILANDAGANVTVSISSFTMRTVEGDVSVNSGTLTGLSYSTLYYLYYDDPKFAGGAVSFVATTTKETALNNSGRFYLGSVLTPAATGPNATGNNDGGTGAQSGGFGIARPNTFTGNGTNPQNAVDNNPTTFASCLDSNALSISQQEVWSGFPNPLNSLAIISSNLQIVSQVIKTNGVSANTTATLEYSLNGGSTWTAIYNLVGTASRAKTTDTVAIAANQDLTKVQVRATATYATGAAVTSVLLKSFDIQIQVTS